VSGKAEMEYANVMKSPTIFAAVLIGSWAAGGLIAAGSPQKNLSNIHLCTEIYRPPKAVAQHACLWRKKSLTVHFLQGDPVVEQRVEKVAKKWTQYSGIEFTFGDFPQTADIRIAFDPSSGSWSYIGLCQSNLKAAEATMNFGWLTPDTDDSEYQRVVLHEFGHALGLLHEHQHPDADIPWNRPAVYEYYKQTQGWDEAKVNQSVFDKYSEAETNHTEYDPQSIMEYPIPKELTLNGFEVGWNYDLSEHDKEFIKQLYATN
jgi:serralysin